MISRRKFLQGSSAMLTLAGTGLSVGFAPRALAASTTNNVLVLLFFRGGMDALNFLVPRTGVNRTEYESKRPNIAIPGNLILNLNDEFGLAGTCPELHDLYTSGHLAMIHSVGMPDGRSSRSHFDSQAMFELGTPGDLSAGTGWLARHLATNPAFPSDAVIGSMAPGNMPDSLVGDPNMLSIDGASTGSFHPNSGRYGTAHIAAMRQMFGGGARIDAAMRGVLNNVETLSTLTLNIPDFYPDSSLADDLGLVAQIIKADLGLQVATVDMGGWDNHENMGNAGTGSYVDRLRVVSEAVGAFFQDLGNAGRRNQVVLATQTDFGRRVRENGNRGTDHGSGQAMMVVGGNIRGGRIYGRFPGIANEQLYLNSDLLPTTDFRRPLSDILRNHLGNPNVQTVFPGYSGGLDMGLVKQAVALPEGSPFFRSGFE
jgi:uncharacterized protein (DUF1501 family)